MFVCVPYTYVIPVEARIEDIESPGTEAIDSCETQCRCWKLNPGPLGEQLVFILQSYLSSPQIQVPVFLCFRTFCFLLIMTPVGGLVMRALDKNHFQTSEAINSSPFIHNVHLPSHFLNFIHSCPSLREGCICMFVS